MKTKLRTQLKEKCKDFGLSEKAIDDLTEAAVKGLKDDATDEDINAAVEVYVPIARAMQGEYTRKVQEAQQKLSQQVQSNQQQQQQIQDGNRSEGNVNNGNGGGSEAPEWAKAIMQQMEAIKADNAALKAEKAKTERAATITAKAKELGIPDFLMKRFTIADDADVDKELADIKQDLVNNSLLPQNGAEQRATSEKMMEADAEAWAKKLADK